MSTEATEELKRQAGFSMLEVMIVTAMLMVAITAIFQVIAAGTDHYNSGSVLVDIQAQARRMMDRIVTDLESSGTSVVSLSGSDSISFQKNTGYSGGSITWGNVITIAFAYETGEIDNGVDDNNNGIVDEGVITRTESGTTVTLGHYLKENGLTFIKVGNFVTIRMELAKPAKGELLETYIETSVLLKN